MDWKDVGGAIANYADDLGDVVGMFVPGAAMGGRLVSKVARAFGLGDKSPDELRPDDLAKAIQADPEAAVKLRQIQSNERLALEEYKVQVVRIEAETERAYLADRQGARTRQVESEKATGAKDVNLYALAWLFTGGFFGTTGLMMWAVVTGKIPENIPQAAVMLLGTLFGTLTAGISGVVQYFFGSSKGSSDKTKLLAEKK